MHIIITDAWLAQSKALHLNGWRLLSALVLAMVLLVLGSMTFYHWVFLKGVREGWPVFGSIARVVTQGEAASREAYLRENLDAMARKLGEMQARMLQLESLGERVAGLAGMNPQEFKKVRLFDQKIERTLVPTAKPVVGVDVGSRFGYRIDPITGRTALHTGLDFPADIGTPILAAAGGVVVVQEYHPAYGNMVEIDHGNQLITRYAHAHRVHVKQGDIVKRGQKIAEVGSTGRSTGPHLHFEVWVAGVPQDPQKFLSAGEALAQKAPTGR